MDKIRRHVSELFCTAAQLRGYTACVTGDGEVTVSVSAGDMVCYMDNLARKVAAAPQHDWAALVADHFGTSVAHFDVDAEPLEEHDFTEIAALVRTRLYGDGAAGQAECVCRPIAPGLMQRVVLDGVHTITPVTYPLMAKWEVDEADLYALGEQNTRADGPVSMERADFPVGAPPWFLLAGGDYTSAHALWLGSDYPDVIGPAGAIFAAPAEHSIYASPIHDHRDVLETGQILAMLSNKHFANDPSPISRHLYRWHDGRVELAACVVSTESSFTLHPTDDFMTMLNQLAT